MDCSLLVTRDEAYTLEDHTVYAAAYWFFLPISQEERWPHGSLVACYIERTRCPCAWNSAVDLLMAYFLCSVLLEYVSTHGCVVFQGSVAGGEQNEGMCALAWNQKACSNHTLEKYVVVRVLKSHVWNQMTLCTPAAHCVFFVFFAARLPRSPDFPTDMYSHDINLGHQTEHV